MNFITWPSKPRLRKRLSLSQKLNIIEELEGDNKPTKRSLARKYNVNESTIRCIFSNRVKIKRMSEMQNNSFSAAKSKIPKETIHQEVEKLLLEWINSLDKNLLPLSSNQIIKKAKAIALELNIAEDPFKDSSQWYLHFKELAELETNNASLVCLDDKDQNDVSTSELESFNCYIKKFEPHNVYNMIETGLFYELLPAPVDELLDDVFQSNRRVNLIMCVNATGSHKVPCTIIENEGDDSRWLGIYTIKQNMAVMDQETFSKWFFSIFHPQIKQKTTQPVVLLVDSSTLHCASEICIENIIIKSMPVFCTSDMIPLQNGIVHAFKAHYKHLLVKEAIDLSVKVKSLHCHNKKPSQVYTPAKRIIKSWGMVHTEMIKRAFVQADLKLDLAPSQEDMFDGCETFARLLTELNVEVTRTEMLNYFCVDNTESSAYLESIINFDSNTKRNCLTAYPATHNLSVSGTKNDQRIGEPAINNSTCHSSNDVSFPKTKNSFTISKDFSTSGVGKGCSMVKVVAASSIGQTSNTYASDTLTKLGALEANNGCTETKNKRCLNVGKLRNSFDKPINNSDIILDKHILSKFREMYQQTNKWELDVSGEEAELFAGKLYGELQSSLKALQNVLEKINKSCQH